MLEKKLTDFARRSALVVLGAIALLWPALLNGGPFWFPDSTSYIRSADAAVVFLTGQRSEWSDRVVTIKEKESQGWSKGSSGHVIAKVVPTRPIYVGRSIYYGFLLYLPIILFGVWGAVVTQALVVASALAFFGSIINRHLGLVNNKVLVLAYLILVTATPLPYFASMMMPDVYAGLLILSTAMLISFYASLEVRHRLILFLLSAIFVTFHSTFILIVAAMGLAAILHAIVRRRSLVYALTTLPVIASGALSIVAFSYAIQASLDEKPISPPFLSARVTATGPGLSYLREYCTDAAEPFLLCRYKDRLPLSHDAFLWNEDPRTGLFQSLKQDERNEIARQDKRFYLATWFFDPLGSARVALNSTIEQALSFGLDVFNYSEERIGKLSDKYPPDVARAVFGSKAAQGEMPVDVAVWLTILSTCLSLLVIATTAISARRKGRGTENAWGFVALVVLAVLANAAICGALSGPKSRYQMRLIWVIPFAAALTVGRSHRSRDRSRNSMCSVGDVA